jgi:hypothetical protein
MTSSLKRRLDKLGSELPTFEEWLGQLGQGGWTEMYSAKAKRALEKGPPYPWREGSKETYLKKVHEELLAARNGSVPPIADPEDDPPSDNRAKSLTVEPPCT